MAAQHLTSVGFFLTNYAVLPASPGFGNARICLLLSSPNFVAGAAQAQLEAISGMPDGAGERANFNHDAFCRGALGDAVRLRRRRDARPDHSNERIDNPIPNICS
jgi:hypothetical protein